MRLATLQIFVKVVLMITGQQLLMENANVNYFIKNPIVKVFVNLATSKDVLPVFNLMIIDVTPVLIPKQSLILITCVFVQKINLI